MSNVLSKDYQKSVKLLTDVFAKADKDIFDSYFSKYDGEAKAIVTIQSNKAGMRIKDGVVLGWCSVKPCWNLSGGLKAYEVNVCAEGLNQAWEDVVGVIVHEMVHLRNILMNVKDTSRNGTYHNALFMQEAQKRMLICREDKSMGYITLPSNKLRTLVESWNLDTSFLVYRDSKQVKTRTAGSVTKWYNYSCPECGQNFKTRKSGLGILCSCSNHPAFKEEELKKDEQE